MRTLQFLRAARSRARRAAAGVTALAAVLALGACDNLLDVEFPGRIPSEQIDNPSLAAVLARSVVSDLECAYSNHSGGSSAHSDEWESANSNVPLANWGERTITADEDSYAVGSCEGAFGMYFTLSSARFQADDISDRLAGWTDAEVANRASLQATVKAYGAYANLLMGETFCRVAYDGEADQPPTAALARAEADFREAITLAQQAGNTDILNLARVGLARALVDQGGSAKLTEAATVAGQVTDGYVKNADRGSENSRRWNEFSNFMSVLGAYTISNELRAVNDQRMQVYNANRGAFNPTTALWLTRKHTSLADPIRLASQIEANLWRAEALIRTGSIQAGLDILNARRAALATPLPALTASTEAQAMAHLIAERRAELSFEGGHRLNDLLRFQLPWKGANGHPRSTNPFTLRPYGATTCWPLPTKETNGA